MNAFLLLVLPALAFRPDSRIYQGVEPTRLRTYHKDPQAALRAGAAWTDFTRGEGVGWQARFDERTGTPHRAWGAGIPMGSLPDDTAVERAMRAFFQRNPGLLGLDPAALTLEKAGYVARTETWYVRFGQRVGTAQVPVYRGAVEARIRFGKLILLGVETYPDAARVDTQPTLSAEQAVAAAIALGPAPQASHEQEGARLVVLPMDDRHSLSYALTWEVKTRTASPVGQWISYVDAQTGALLNVHNNVKFLSGTLTGTHDTRTVDGEFSTSAIPFAYIEGDDDTTTSADADGEWSIDGASAATTTFHGTKVCTVNDRGDDGVLSLSGDATWTDDDATQAEIDSYLFLHDVVAWAEEYAPEVSVLSEGRNACDDTDVIVSIVNQNSTCNAYYDGSLNFFKDGGGCNNTGRIADVNYHEWGHGFHYYNMESGTYDSSISEGIGDSVSVMQTGDSEIAPYFVTSGSGIRDVAPNHVYPDDWVGESHEDGLIFAGAVWDLWAELELAYPGDADTAYDTLATLFVDGIKGGPEIPDSYDEFVSADDDNGDLSDGTPNQCAIINAFGEHGLGPGGGEALLTMSHTPLENQVAGTGAYALDAEVVNLAPTCVELGASSAVVHYSTDGGESWFDVDLSTDGSSVWGEIPAQADGTIITYYVEVTGEDGTVVSAPTGGAINPYTFFVGELVEISCEDFEDDDGDYTHELLDGKDELGADDWVWGRPQGAGGDPDYAYSGDRVWGNDLGGGNYNGQYQDDKQNRLTAPAIDISGYDRVVLQYRRWLGVEDGYYDQATVLASEVEVWQNHGTSSSIGNEQTEDDQWMLHTLDLPIDGTGSVTLAWDLKTDGGLGFGGWTLDDVCVYGFVPAEVVVDTGSDTGETGDTGAEDSSLEGNEDSGENEESAAVEDTGGLVVKPTGCGCATSSDRSTYGAWAALALAGLVGLRRRRFFRG